MLGYSVLWEKVSQFDEITKQWRQVMKKEWRKRILPITLSFVVASSIISPNFTSALGTFDVNSSIVQTPINEYQVDLAPGVKEKHYSFEGKDGKRIESFVVDVDVQNPNVAIEAGTPNDGDAFGLQPVRQQAKAADGDNHKVVAAVNSDFYNMATGEPIGVVYKDGRAIKATTGLPQILWNKKIWRSRDW